MVNILSKQQMFLVVYVPAFFVLLLLTASNLIITQSAIKAPAFETAAVLANQVEEDIYHAVIEGDVELTRTLLKENKVAFSTMYVALYDGRIISYEDITQDQFLEKGLSKRKFISDREDDLIMQLYPIEDIGMLRVDTTIPGLSSTLKNNFRNHIIVVILGGIALGGLLWFVLKFIHHPIKQIKEVYQNIAKGRYEIDVGELQADQTGRLIKGYIQLAQGIAELKRKLYDAQHKSQLQIQSEVDRLTQHLRYEMMDEKELAHKLTVINDQLEEAKDNLRKKQDQLEKSNLELKQAHEKLHMFNEELEVKVQERTKELVEANMRIKHLLDMKSQFVSQVSHDLRTPLTPIMTLLPLVKSDIEKMPDSTTKKDLIEMLERVNSNADYLLNIVTDTLSISRLDTGSVKMNLQDLDIHEIISDVIQNQQVVFDEKKIKTFNKVASDLPKIKADPLRIKEVFNNLIMNSMKFMEDKKELVFDAKVKGKMMELSVKDSGIGIKQEFLGKIFEEFFKADPSRHEHSSGLGLSICKRIVNKHGGKIWVESEGPGKGSTFIFTLPLA